MSITENRFKGLSNEEISYIYFYLDNKLSDYDDIINNNGISHVIEGPLGKVGFFQEYSEEKIDLIKNAHKIKYMRNIVNKLKPIVDIISDAEPKLVDNVIESINVVLLSRFNDENHDDESENM